MLESHGFKPVNADMHMVRIVIAAGNFQILAFGGTATHKNCVITFRQQLGHALDGGTQPQIDAHVDNHSDFFVEHVHGKPERRNIGPHQTTGLVQGLVHDNFVTQGDQVVSHCQGRASGTDASDPLAVFHLGRRGQQL
jgi:hypothetical protein